MFTSLFKLIGSKQNPRGPGFRRNRPHQLELSGTRIIFRTPPNSDINVQFKKKPEKYNLYDLQIPALDPESNELPWKTIYTEGWSFFGLPVIQSEIGCLTMAVVIVHNNRHGNLFSPDNFIKALDEKIKLDYGPGSGMYQYISCLDWQVQQVHGNDWVRFNSERIGDLHNYAVWVIPISEEHMLFFGFPHFVHRPGTKLNEAYRILEDQIMSTVTIEWSEDILRQKQAAVEQWPEVKLPERRPVMEWPDCEWEKHKPYDPMAELRETAERIKRERAEREETEKQLRSSG